MHVILLALRRCWLMCGLLVISAHHLAALADDTMTKRLHREGGTEFSTGFGQTTAFDIDLEAAEIGEEGKNAGDQIRCLLHCAQWELAEPAFDYELGASCQLLSITSPVRGCVVPDSTLRDSGIRNKSHGRQEEGFVQELLHTTTSSHGGSPYANSSSDNTPSALLNLLRALPFRIAEGLGRPESAQDVFVTLSAITAVIECCDISFACDEAGAA